MGVVWVEGESGVRRWEQHNVGAKNRMVSVQVSYRLYGSEKGEVGRRRVALIDVMGAKRRRR
jgi:hypothetical protein